MIAVRYIYLLIGSILAILLFIKAISGGKYSSYVENLDSDEFPLRFLYCIGLAWNESKMFALRGTLKESLIGQAKLLYDVRYSEYYATVVWAQCISFIHIGLTFGFILAGALDSILMLVIGAAVGGVFGFYFLTRMKELVSTREIECTAELPEIVSTMALLINAGMILRDVWRLIANSKEGTVYTLMKNSCADMESGMSDTEAMLKFARLTNSTEIRKFTSALTQSMERGSSELSDFLGKQSMEMWKLKKQLMLQKGEAAASKLLAPTAMLFVGIIVAVMSGALGMLI